MHESIIFDYDSVEVQLDRGMLQDTGRSKMFPGFAFTLAFGADRFSASLAKSSGPYVIFKSQRAGDAISLPMHLWLTLFKSLLA